MKKFLFALPAFVVGGLILASGGVSAAVPSATTTLDTIMGIIITTTVSLATTIFTTYWPYILVVGVIVGLIAVFKRLVNAGHK